MKFPRIVPFECVLVCLCVFAGTGIPASSGFAAPLRESDLKLTTSIRPAKAGLSSEVRFSRGPRGGRYLEVELTNRTGSDVNIDSLSLEFPWLEGSPGDLLVSSGGTVMNYWPGRIADPSVKNGSVESGTYLMARQGGRYALAGFLTWNTFWSKIRLAGTRVVMTGDGEGRLVRPGESVRLEKLWFADGTDWQDLLFAYADEIAREQGVKLKPQPKYVGWSTWDYYGRDWTPKNVTDNMEALKQIVPSANLLQIDGGWWPARGDFMSVRKNLEPGGMKELASKIRRAGMTAGIHFDGMRGDRSSKVAREHPDYFLHDQEGRMISEPQPNNDGDRLDNTYFDFSNPGALDYTREVARNMRRNWGFDYIKIDFLIFGINEDIRKRAIKGDAVRRIAPHNPALTSVERLRLALKAWRQGMGDDAYFLACSAPFGPVFGIADGLRTGPDIFPNFDFYRLCSEANASAFYLHGRVVWNDADYHVVRGKADEDNTLVRNPAKSGGNLTLNEAEMWSRYVGLFGGTKLNSDNLGLLRAERKRLFQEAASLPPCSRYVPLDFWNHARDRHDSFHVMLGEAADGVYLAYFNWSDESRDYAVTGVAAGALPAPVVGEAQSSLGNRAWTVRLPPRHSVVYRLSPGTSFDAARKTLRLE
ncbi:MAG: alpha-galactosidase [Opitutaceae bacterium]|nr:alpha-galactosidase [Opitutaceae bacterium]